MYILAVNGSPRKNWNTATLLKKALEGAVSEGAETELVHLYDFTYQGCISCFSCKLKAGKSYGKCALEDDLTPLLEKVEKADALILGSPIYLGNVTGEMRSFIERLVFPYLIYDINHSSLFKKKIPIGFIYTMNVTEDRMNDMGYIQNLGFTESILARIFGRSESLYVNDTYQFTDYSQYVVTAFNEADKTKRRKEFFPIDCEKAFAMGRRFASAITG